MNITLKTSTFKARKGSKYIRAVIIHNSVSEQREAYSYLGYSISYVNNNDM
jgi:ribosomal protein L35AE/L33A